MSHVVDQLPPPPGGSRGFVKPRASLEPGGASLPILKLIEPHIGHPERRGAIYIVGPAGSGKTWSIHYLSAVLGRNERIWLLDEPEERYWELKGTPPLTIIATSNHQPTNALAVLHLAPWTDDDLIEWLCNGGYRDRVASVMARVTADNRRGLLRGIPQLWRIVLDEMLADEHITSCSAPLRKRALSNLDGKPRETALEMCLKTIHPGVPVNPQLLSAELKKLVRHNLVCELLAAEAIVWRLEQRNDLEHLRRTLPRALVLEAGRLLRQRPDGVRRLEQLLAGNNPAFDAMAASLMLVAQPEWKPDISRRLELISAQLSGARWAAVKLQSADLVLAELTGADLSDSTLDHATATGADFSGANLMRASMRHLRAAQATFKHANLTDAIAFRATFSSSDLSGALMTQMELVEANLRQCMLAGANLIEANLRGADLSQAHLAEADFTGADLTEAEARDTDLSVATWGATRFRRAKLLRCNLEGLDIPGAQFAQSDLRGSYITGSRMPGADFSSADLRETGLADIDWPNASLRDADLRGCTFHMGSSRSGLVGSIIPCEGSKTGFYTDDYVDQDFKAPEEIRKANLCGADLTGAKIDGVDFYLVDLRGAKYSFRQSEHLARCGAILHSRVR